MKAIPSALRSALILAACASLAACAHTPRNDLNYQSRPAPTAADKAPDAQAPRLTIQSGEGERLNLPWFIRGTQDWVNSH
ncbi:hypothetical protein [Bordetella avium]|uniref:Lipoprotein n=1 Tax=Bordetella avium (strain 197N) TaxID=360910 RepID=Q2KXK2_BORA1|nr:hypothetical protein [Bordetella avium]AZY48196.1 hypothetical protein C0J09_02875 [Bordetella avium]AZY51576.1 hypothetical protein C0J07_02930 [Bordetella avium]RIQ13560.1 hypothetical protein D0432_10175 [Bordetella avium]RIQ16486.1 hypothetical protein D0850_13920 [Bordetella avium]RIQ31244.1 hypothetical protein D0849_14015 [Bordetella avium]